VSSEPAEHIRFHHYVHALSQVSDSDEKTLIAEVLTDPDHAMADAVILGHLDRRAAALGGGPAFTSWSQQLAPILRGRVLPERRLREWLLIKDIDSGRAWNAADLFQASDWLQRNLVERTASQQALTILAREGRTRRIRNAARSRMDPT
jgi:hypothetical protein